MMSSPDDEVFVLDTNIQINLSLWLPQDLNRAFWTKLEEALQAGKCILLDVVVQEIKYGNDGLLNWVRL